VSRLLSEASAEGDADGHVAEEWPARGGAVIRRGYLVLTLVALLACVVAAARTL
jgi:hypothetical protein